MGEEIKVNDGGGLFDYKGLIDSLIIDCNNGVKAITSGEYIGWCGLNVQMVQKLTALKKGVTNDMESRETEIRKLREENDEMRQRIIEYQEKGVN